MTNEELDDRLDLIEYRQELLFESSHISRIYFEYKVTRSQSKLIGDIFDRYRDDIENNIKVFHSTFEQEIYGIVPQNEGDYHFVESVAKTFHESGSWEEVFEKLYGGMTKYKFYMENKD